MCTFDGCRNFGSIGANGDALRVKTLGEAAFGHAALDTRLDEMRVFSENCGFPNSTPRGFVFRFQLPKRHPLHDPDAVLRILGRWTSAL